MFPKWSHYEDYIVIELDLFRYITILGIIGLLAQYIGVPFLSDKLKCHDSTIALLDAGTSCINQFILAFATAEYVVSQNSKKQILFHMKIFAPYFMT